MYYYGFIMNIDFEEIEVTKQEFEAHCKRKIDRHFDRYLHHRDVAITTQTDTVTNLFERPVFSYLFNRRVNILSDVAF